MSQPNSSSRSANMPTNADQNFKKTPGLAAQRSLDFVSFESARSLRPPTQGARRAETQVPLFGSYVPAGFPSPAQDYKEESLDLNELCVQHPTATYYVRASGESMLGAGIHDTDILVVDRSIQATHGHIVVAALNGDFTVKVLNTSPTVSLEPRNDAFDTIAINESDDFEIFGVVTYVIHSTLR